MNSTATPYGLGHILFELMMLMKEGLEQRPQERLSNKGRLEYQREHQRKKQLLPIEQRKKSLTRGHVKDIGSTVGIQPYP